MGSSGVRTGIALTVLITASLGGRQGGFARGLALREFPGAVVTRHPTGTALMVRRPEAQGHGVDRAVLPLRPPGVLLCPPLSSWWSRRPWGLLGSRPTLRSLPPSRGLHPVCPWVSIKSVLLRTPAMRLRPSHIHMVSSKQGCICKDLFLNKVLFKILGKT